MRTDANCRGEIGRIGWLPELMMSGYHNRKSQTDAATWVSLEHPSAQVSWGDNDAMGSSNHGPQEGHDHLGRFQYLSERS